MTVNLDMRLSNNEFNSGDERRDARLGVARKVVLISLPVVLLMTVIMELFFRFVVPATNMPRYRWVDEYEILSHDPSWVREGVYTTGPSAIRLGGWRINDAGWNSPIELDA